jgi:hypothetical protein
MILGKFGNLYRKVSNDPFLIFREQASLGYKMNKEE